MQLDPPPHHTGLAVNDLYACNSGLPKGMAMGMR